MNRLKRYLRKTNPLIYPSSELEVWKDLKNEYFKFDYIWIELDVHHSISEIRDADYKNMKKFKEMKKNELNLRNSIRGGVIMPQISPPMRPNNYDRYKMLQRWNKNHNSFNTCMATLELYKNHNLEPVRDYEPDAVMDVYYSKLSGGSRITRSRSESSVVQDIRRLRTTPEPVNEIVPTAPPVFEEERIDDSLRTYHLRETGCLITTRLPSYDETV
jgi:hypothetical protein